MTIFLQEILEAFRLWYDVKAFMQLVFLAPSPTSSFYPCSKYLFFFFGLHLIPLAHSDFGSSCGGMFLQRWQAFYLKYLYLLVFAEGLGSLAPRRSSLEVQGISAPWATSNKEGWWWMRDEPLNLPATRATAKGVVYTVPQRVSVGIESQFQEVITSSVIHH